ncbi:hypothetical protein TNCV_3523721 [Trichonephila clavipes]|nr:hypothetical protein TNCV_3523721 [Trichonephila clavipes]
MGQTLKMAEQTSTTKPVQGGHRLPDETIAKVETAMLEDRRTTVRELCERFRDHKRQRVEAAQEFLAFTEQPKRNFWTLLLLVTRPGYTTPHRKQRAIEAVETPFVAKSKEVQQILSAGKIMASIFWDRKGVLLCEICACGQQSMLTGTVRP